MTENVEWNGYTDREITLDYYAASLDEIADAGSSKDWVRLVSLARESEDLVNCWRLGDTSLYAPLHYVACGNAPVEVANELIELGAWRALRDGAGERPLDIARRMGHELLVTALEPRYLHFVPMEILRKIQSHFHETICVYVGDLIEEQALRLPELEPLLELEEPAMWFRVPGMYGGYNYWFETVGEKAMLVAECAIRIVSGSYARYEITEAGSTIVEGDDD